jgi:catechol 2,3-dioxygenase-like lactoylglutathione lyase family enzyme
MPDLAYDAGADFIVTWDRLLLNADLLFGVEEVVEELTSRGVIFERYEEGPIITDDKGIATFEGGAKVAYFRDPDGNTLSVARAPRS